MALVSTDELIVQQQQPVELSSLPLSPLAQLYDSLRVDKDSIRLLDLEPEPRSKLFSVSSKARSASALKGTLRVALLRECPKFTALSYVWGRKADPSDVILCNKIPIEITPNCRDALQAVRKLKGRITIWVDSVCIDQSNGAEKASQIPLMGDIYTWAEMVYVWLGRGTERSDHAIEMLRIASRASTCLEGNRIECLTGLSKGLRGLRALGQLLWLTSPWSLALRLKSESYLRKENNDPRCLEDLLSREWFSRAWTFQELILPRDIVILCGTQALDWDHFLRGMWTTQNFTYKAGPMGWFPLSPWEDLGLDRLDYLTEWYRILELWMNIKRKTTWGTRKMRSDNAGTVSFRNYQSPVLSLYHWWYKNTYKYPVLFLLNLPISLLWFLIWGSPSVSLPVLLILLGPGLLYVFILSAIFVLLAFLVYVFIIIVGISATPLHVSFADKTVSHFDPRRDLARILPQAVKYRHATEPRDRIYAIYGILLSFDLELSPIDYSKTETQVFTDFFSTLLQWSEHYLVYVVDAGLSDDANKPSWVPDWKTALERSWLPADVYTRRLSRAAILTTPHAQVVGNALQVRCVMVCKAAFVSGPFEKLKGGDVVELLEKPVAIVCEMIHRARLNMPLDGAYDTVATSIYKALRAQGSPTDESSTFHGFSKLHEKIKAKLGRGDGGEGAVDYAAISKKLLQKFSTNTHHYLKKIFEELAGKRNLFDTYNGYIGSGPPNMTEGDLVAYIAGVPVPMILREADVPTTYRLLGPAFVVGLMEGEGWAGPSPEIITLV